MRGVDVVSTAAASFLDLEASVPLTADATLSVGGQNVFDTFSDRMDLFAARFGLPYSRFTQWGLSGGYCHGASATAGAGSAWGYRARRRFA